MAPPNTRVLRYTRAWLAGPEAVVETETTLDRAGTPVPATIVRPRGVAAPLPAWIVLHGLTKPGRAHAQLVRFTQAVASAGMTVIVPEVPEWRRLSMAPHLTAPTVRAAIDGLRSTGTARAGPVGLVAFSFAVPHAIATMAHPELRDEIAGACGFGGYCSLERTFRFLLDGHHEWLGTTHHLRPDPYGRWVVGANYLTAANGYEDAGDVADGLRTLALHAGDVGAASWDPVYDAEIRRIRSSICEERRPTFDLFAAESSGAVRRSFPPELAARLAEAARRLDPGVDPTNALGRVRGPVHILHGRKDHLIPFTESCRLYDALGRAERRLTVTRLFGHSNQDPFPTGALFIEVPRFLRALGAALSLV